MCGFCGFTGNTAEESKEVVITNMMDKIIHRGPDGAGKHVDEDVALGFRRLSIIDLTEGDQPIYNETEELVLLFNGEIYNYSSIRAQLAEKGHIFRTKTDSEVLLHGYEEYGTKLFDYLRGMFAFVIWDKRNKTLFGARDFFGIKPFYYANVNGNLIFGSEIKSILEHPDYQKELNLDALQNYLTFQYSALPETFFKGIYKLPPAHYFVFKNGDIEVTRYWEASFNGSYSNEKALEDYVTATEVIMEDSIKAHKISDVEVGSFLSSGIDSSYVAASFQGDKTFTVGFNHYKYNEIDDAKELSQKVGIANYHKVITTEEYWEALDKVQYHMDEPLADPSAVALYFVSQLASEHVKVVLSGEGADELFGGYNIYKEPLSLKPLTFLPRFIRKALGRLAQALPFEIKGKNYLIRASKSVEERFIGNAFIFNEAEREQLLKITNYQKISPFSLTKPFYDKVKNHDDVTKMQYLDIHLWLTGDILLKADKMSMAHSLELRVPFLDKEVARVATRIPLKYRVNRHNTKYALRLAAKKKLEDKVADKKKLGFPVPIRVWLKEEKYYNLVKDAFTSDVAKQFFHHQLLVRLLDEHLQDKKDNSRKIWTIFMFLVWYNQYFPNSVPTSTEKQQVAESNSDTVLVTQ